MIHSRPDGSGLQTTVTTMNEAELRPPPLRRQHAHELGKGLGHAHQHPAPAGKTMQRGPVRASGGLLFLRHRSARQSSAATTLRREARHSLAAVPWTIFRRGATSHRQKRPFVLLITFAKRPPIIIGVVNHPSIVDI